MFWYKEYRRCESGNLRWQQYNKIVAFFFVHGFHDSIKFLHDGWVVAVSPIGHEVFPQAVCVEYIRAPGCHDAVVALQQFAINIQQDVTNDIVHVPVHCSVITSEITHDEAGVHFVMDDAGN